MSRKQLFSDKLKKKGNSIVSSAKVQLLGFLYVQLKCINAGNSFLA